MPEDEKSYDVDKRAKKVYNVACRITANPHDADEVTQETFIQVYRNRDKFRGESTLYTWMYRIAVNASPSRSFLPFVASHQALLLK